MIWWKDCNSAIQKFKGKMSHDFGIELQFVAAFKHESSVHEAKVHLIIKL